MGEVIVETRSEAFGHEVALGAAIVAGGILMHYLVARGLAAWRIAKGSAEHYRSRGSLTRRARGKAVETV
jgi:hypothetical protein